MLLNILSFVFSLYLSKKQGDIYVVVPTSPTCSPSACFSAYSSRIWSCCVSGTRTHVRLVVLCPPTAVLRVLSCCRGSAKAQERKKGGLMYCRPSHVWGTQRTVGNNDHLPHNR